jgi:hypothetical protein
MRRGLVLLLWLCGGHAIAAGLYASLINVPDANVSLLIASALLVMAVLLTVGVTNATAVAWFTPSTGFRAALGGAIRRGLPALLVALVVFAVVWWSAAQLDAWHRAHRGEIDAWLMATFGTARTMWAHRVVGVVVFVLGAIVAVSMALAVFSAVVLDGFRALLSARWVAAAWSRAQLGIVALAVVIFFVLPWRAVGWRPGGIPPAWVEVAFVATKLTVVYVVAHVGWALMLFVASRSAAGATRTGPATTSRREWTA